LTKVPSLDYKKIVKALERDGWVIDRQKGSHISMEKFHKNKKTIIVIPAHKSVKRPILAKILKQAKIPLDRFLELL
jgi:predicted RNA binding protein YcfA (HicA-like mRNA interferase family)